MKKLFLCTLIVGISFLANCSGPAISHDEDMAANSAIQFARVAIVQHDMQNGYALLSDKMRKKVTLEEYTNIVHQMHSTSYPLFLSADEFEPIPGQKGMNIFLHGDNGTEQFYYRMTVEGTAGTGYKVVGFSRRNSPYPPSKLKQKFRTSYST